MDGLDGIPDCEGLAADIVGAFFADVDVHGLVDGSDDSQGYEVVGDVDPVVVARPAESLDKAVEALDAEPAVSDAGFLHFADHGLVGSDLGRPVIVDDLAEKFKVRGVEVGIRREPAQDMDLGRLLVQIVRIMPDRAQLDPVDADHVIFPAAVLVAGGPEFIDAGQGVVVGQGDHFEPGLFCLYDDLLRRVRSVRKAAVHVKINIFHTTSP